MHMFGLPPMRGEEENFERLFLKQSGRSEYNLCMHFIRKLGASFKVGFLFSCFVFPRAPP